MDEIQRQQFAEVVQSAMTAKGWSAAHTAKVAKLSATTMTRLTEGKRVAGLTIGKVMRALEIEPLADAQAKEGYPLDIELVRDTIGLWLREVAVEERPAMILRLFEAIMQRPPNGV